jgi:hypothetical protein
MNLIPFSVHFYLSKFLNIILLYGLLLFARIVPESDLIQTSECTYARVRALIFLLSPFPEFLYEILHYHVPKVSCSLRRGQCSLRGGGSQP